MKNIKYLMIAVLCSLFITACMDGDWDEPNTTDSAPYGNDYLTESNLMTIAQLKSKYSSTVNNSSMQEVTEDIQIKGRITGNDQGGNIYNEVALQDETGAIIIAIAQGGLWGYLPVGQEILVSLKGLYVGAYGKMPEIGMPFTSKAGSTYVSRMNRVTWNQHFKIVGTADESKVAPIDFSTSLNITADCGKLVTMKNVTMKDANGKAVFAPSDGSVTLTANCANRATKEYNSNSVIVRTSTYADFANLIMPTGKLNITGIATRYNNTWQILIRTEKDIQTAQ